MYFFYIYFVTFIVKIDADNNVMPTITSSWDLIIILILIMPLIAIFSIIYCIYNTNYHKNIIHKWTKKIIIEHKANNLDGDFRIPSVRIEKIKSTNVGEYELPFDSDWELPRSKLKLGCLLGEGAFGRVLFGEAFGIPNLKKKTTVAVKMLQDDHTDLDLINFVREIEFMKFIGQHDNVLRLLACCTQDGSLFAIVEYAAHGNLRDFLRNHRPETTALSKCFLEKKILENFAYQVANGMKYLSAKRYVHRDLAARNVLVCDNYILKISDFGFARELQSSDYYRRNTNGLFPIKWMAPESIYNGYSDCKSDM